MDHTTNYHDWWHVPPGQYTKKQLLKKHRRLPKDAPPVGTITCVFDKPRCRPKNVESVPPEECERVRNALRISGPDAADQSVLYRLDRAGQIVTMNLYDVSDTSPITSFAEVEAKTLLEYMLWDDSHEDHYITEATEDGGRKRATWKHEVSTPDLTPHLAGDRYFGVKKGRRTMQVVLDCDRHSGAVPGEHHITKTLDIGRVLTRHFPRYRFAPEINEKNGSVKFFGWLPDYMPMPLAEPVAEKVRSTLQAELPRYDFSRLEIFPRTPQIFAPLRADKITVIGGGGVPQIDKYRMRSYNGRRRREYYKAYSCAAYINWIYASDMQYDERIFERHLREAVARCPDKPAAEAQPTVQKKAPTKKPSPGGMGSIGSLKGRCASALVRFWSELDLPEDDTIGKYIIVTLRILRYEGLSREEALEWVEDRLQALQNTEFSDRLTDNVEEIRRVMAFAAKAVWEGNGYQKDPVASEAKLKAAVAAWRSRGFSLHDPATWNMHRAAVVPDMKLVWTPALLALIPELAALAHGTEEQARSFIETVLNFVECNNELAESMVGNLLEEVGIKGKSRQKQHDVRKLLVEKGLLLKRKNYFCDSATGYRHGNFYICGAGVRFEEEQSAPPHTPHTVSIDYLSLDIEPIDDTSHDWLDFVMEGRRLSCDQRYRERLRRLNRQFSRAA